MEAGRELDILIAEKVMQWRRIDGTDYTEPVFEYAEGRLKFAPKYSTDMTTAMQVIECMEQFGYSYYIEGGWHNYVYVAFKHKNDESLAFTSDHERGSRYASEAICLAALKVLGVEV
jgi:hypothetical protein